MDVKSNAEDSWTYLGEIILNNVFTWQDVSLQDLLTQATENSTSDMSATTRYLRLSLTDNDASLIELVFLDANGNITRPLNADAYLHCLTKAICTRNAIPSATACISMKSITHARLTSSFTACRPTKIPTRLWARSSSPWVLPSLE